MSFWFWHGMTAGIQTSRYPRKAEIAAGISPGRPANTEFQYEADAETAAAICPTEAIKAHGREAHVDHGKCVQCQRCRLELETPMNWETSYEWARIATRPERSSPIFPSAFSKSLHIMVVDAGDCGACLHEVNQLNNPLYNMHRLGFFFSATPRAADLLLVVGPVSENMRGPLLRTWEAMPSTRRVMAVGSCAISGGVFGRSYMCAGGVSSVLSVDFEVPGDPPPPLAILHGLLVATGRKPSTRGELVAEGRS